MPASLLPGVIVLDALDADAVRAWSRVAVQRLAAHRREIDALNVFPVADGDTGSNLLQTVRASGDALGARPEIADVGAAFAVMADAAALAAVGNSGFIGSQVLRGFATASRGCVVLGATGFAAALEHAATLSRAAVVTPVEGTMLTVARAAADGARGDTLAAVATSSLAAADAALQLTTEQLPELAEHQVVDAGGRGLLVLLEALVHVVIGAETELTPVRPPSRRHGSVRETGSPQFAFEVQFVLDAPDTALPALRGALAALGDSLAVVPLGSEASESSSNSGSSGHAARYKVHVHVNDVGAAIEAGIEAGRPSRIEVVRFADHEDSGTSAVVAIAPGAGLAHLFQSEGVHVVDWALSAGRTEDVVAAIRAAGAENLVLLPNAADVRALTEEAARITRAEGLRVAVVPTRSPVQGLAAVAVHDPSRRFDDDVVAMAEAAAATRFAEVRIAAAESLTAVGICQPGDVLGFIDGEVVEIGRGLLAVAFGLVDRLLGVGAELMTVVVGSEVPRRTGELIEAHVRGRAPFTDVTVYEGGQADHPVIIGVE